jgi:hypothetical protein
MGDNIGKALIEAGLPPAYVAQFVEDLLAQNKSGLGDIPGTTPAIIESGVSALLDTYVSGFRNVWVSALCFIVLAAIGTNVSSIFKVSH